MDKDQFLLRPGDVFFSFGRFISRGSWYITHVKIDDRHRKTVYSLRIRSLISGTTSELFFNSEGIENNLIFVSYISERKLYAVR